MSHAIAYAFANEAAREDRLKPSWNRSNDVKLFACPAFVPESFRLKDWRLFAPLRKYKLSLTCPMSGCVMPTMARALLTVHDGAPSEIATESVVVEPESGMGYRTGVFTVKVYSSCPSARPSPSVSVEFGFSWIPCGPESATVQAVAAAFRRVNSSKATGRCAWPSEYPSVTRLVVPWKVAEPVQEAARAPSRYRLRALPVAIAVILTHRPNATGNGETIDATLYADQRTSPSELTLR